MADEMGGSADATSADIRAIGARVAEAVSQITGLDGPASPAEVSEYFAEQGAGPGQVQLTRWLGLNQRVIPPGHDSLEDEQAVLRIVGALLGNEAEDSLSGLWFDLTGLPPPADRVDAFAANPSEEAWGALVEELLAAPQSFHPDLIVIGLEFPETSGFIAARKLRESGIEVPIVGLSLKASSEVRQQCIDAGMDDFFGKPFRVDDLMSAVSSLMAHSFQF
jgi:CheY-like chemotaxis protein